MMMNDRDFGLLLAKLRPVAPDLTDALWLGSLMEPTRSNDIKAVAQALAAERLGESYTSEHILLPPPPGPVTTGELRLGRVVYAGRPVSEFGLRDGDLPQHVAILGRSGSGKTNVAHLLVDRLVQTRKPFMVLDWRCNYASFAGRGPGRGVLILQAGETKSIGFNPLQSPGGLTRNQREAYVRDIASVICTTYLPGNQLLSTRGVEYLLLKAIGDLQLVGPEPVTFNDVRRYLDTYKPRSREGDWKASAANVLLRLTTGPIGRMFGSPTTTTLARILDKQIVLEVDSLGSQSDRAAFTKALLVWLFYHRLSEGRSTPSKHVLVIEEAHQCFQRRRDGEQSVPDLMLRQMRDLGQSIVLLDQNPSLLSVPALGNTATTICLNLKHANDLEAAGKALTLPRAEWEHIGRLPVGQAIVKVASRHPTPFLVQFPLWTGSAEENTPRTEGRAERTPSLKRSVEEARLALQEAIRAFRKSDRGERNEEGKTVREERGLGKRDEGVDTGERVLLADIARSPLSVVTERYRRLGWSAHAGTETKRRVVEGGLVEEERVRVPEGSVTLLRLTPAGEAAVGASGVQAVRLPKNAGLEHEYWKHRIGDRYRREGYEVEEEVAIGDGKAVDIVASKAGERIAVEVETGCSNAVDNIQKAVDAGFDRVVSVGTTPQAKRQILGALAMHGDARSSAIKVVSPIEVA